MRRRMCVLGLAASAFLATAPQAFADYIEPSVTFTTLNLQQIAPAFFLNATYDLTIINHTGQTWTDFEFQLPSVTTAALFFSSYSGPGSYTINNVTTGTSVMSELDVLGLSIADGASYTPNVSIATAEGAGYINGKPSVGSVTPPSVPEPGTRLLVMLGLSIPAIIAWRSKRRHTR